ncbi:phenylacetate--CoA ligase family protein [Methanolobus chelungpuianus]|uniref:Capsule biosynthesis protein CapK n=1 Tax=Methanolobus chelungpuianus TaxID=502115 RepID=A0AAE3KWA0_9EURY|nr:hypothetical protein [Methanolobus chelungpuianus]MCQ6962315.1 hypothetical protein [Methanolobus chelungpuianus]
MPIDSILSRHLIFPAGDYIKRTKSLQYLKYLNRTQWLKPEELRQIQEQKLRHLIEYAYNNVPYYHKLFRSNGLTPDQIRTVDDLSKIPPLTKDLIRANGPDLLSSSVSRMYRNTSGGTTGDPLVSYKDLNTMGCSLSSTYRGWSWGGYNPGDRYATLWRSPDTINKYSSGINRVQNALRRNLLLNCFDIGRENMYAHAVTLNKYKPKIIRSSPSAGFAMAEFLGAESVERPSPMAFFTAAEKLYSFQRKRIESIFSCDVFDSYGSNEIRAMAYECEEHCGYHISVENVVIEFLSNGEKTSPGELGEIIITDLTNFAMPFLRYRIGDVGIPSDETCSCGRGLPLLHSIEGRSNSIVQTKDKGLLKSSFFADLLIDSHLVENFQIIQNSPSSADVRIQGSDASEREKILLLLRENLGEFDINLSHVSHIEPARSGKLQLVISNIPLEL